MTWRGVGTAFALGFLVAKGCVAPYVTAAPPFPTTNPSAPITVYNNLVLSRTEELGDTALDQIKAVCKP